MECPTDRGFTPRFLRALTNFGDGGEEIATGSVLVRQGRAVPGDEVGVP